MPVTQSRPRAARRTRIKGELTLRGQQYPFVIYRQRESLGSAGPIQYYYMLPSDFRGLRTEDAQTNFRSCIGFWYAGMQELGLGDDPYQQRRLVLAISYGILGTQKSLQNVYLDAFLKPKGIDLSMVSVSEEPVGQIRQAIDARDRTQIKRLLDEAFDAYLPSQADLVGFGEALAHWADKGVSVLRLQGTEGLKTWLGEIEYWVQKYRKSSKTDARVRDFVNFFSYQAKASFYLCFANFWASLIPWLEQQHDLDRLSKRFLSLWHHQNQPIETPHGETPGGIIYPTHGRARLLVPDGSGQLAPKEVAWKTPRIGPEVVHDVFSGQVLSLHPLTWFFLSDEALCEVAGRFFNLPNFETVMSGRSADNCDEYWELVGAIVTAAFQYRSARSEFERQHHVVVAGGDSTKAVTRGEAPAALATGIEDYILHEGIRCRCGANLCFLDLQPMESIGAPRGVQLRCEDCGATKQVELEWKQFCSYLYPDDDEPTSSQQELVNSL